MIPIKRLDGLQAVPKLKNCAVKVLHSLNLSQTLDRVDIHIMGDTSVDAKTVLDSVKSSTWKFLKFQMSGGEVDIIFTTFVK